MITFRKAVASEAKPLIGLYAESGCGKTRSALLIAKGYSDDMSRVGMIETESGRGEAYADDPVIGGYNVISLRDEFSPKTYGAAIRKAEEAGLQVLIVDSASHEWEGVGGVLSMASDNQAAGKKGVLVWQLPKIEHQREFMLRITQTPIPLVIVCMRAKYPMQEQSKPGGGKEWVRSTRLEPKQSEDILSEMFVHGWIDTEHKFHGTKYTLEAYRQIFVDGERITVDTGKRLAAWAAAGKSVVPRTSTAGSGASTGSELPTPGATEAHVDGAASVDGFITPDQVVALETLLTSHDIKIEKLLAAASVERLARIRAVDYDKARKWLDTAIERRRAP